MLYNYFSIRQFQLTKWSFFVHSTMRNGPYILPSHDSIFELRQTFPNVFIPYIMHTTHAEPTSNTKLKYTVLECQATVKVIKHQGYHLFAFLIN